MPLYNKERDVARAIRSALAQTFTDYELIVVNDGSTDHSVDAVATFNDPRIRLVHQENQGVSAARNRGVSEARAKLVAFLDADDEWLPEFLSTIMRMHTTYGECSVYATSYFINCAGKPERRAVLRGVPEGFSEGVLENYFHVATHSDPPIWSSAVAIKRVAIIAEGGFPVGVAVGEDLLTWAKLATKHEIAYCPSPKAIFHLRESVHGVPMRLPDEPDIVGRLLEDLLPDITPINLTAFKQYLGLWYRMRASVYFRAGKTLEGCREFQKMSNYSKKDSRYFVYLSIASSPKFLSKRLMGGLVLLKKGLNNMQKAISMLR